MSPRVLASTAEMPEVEWLELRRTAGIGASEVAACAGLDPWTSPTSLVLRKLGQLEPQPETPAMKWGKILEAPVADEFARCHPELRVARRRQLLQSERWPWMIANLDRQARPVGGGAVEPVEVKTAHFFAFDEWSNGQVPDHYLCQVQAQLAILEADSGWLVGLIGGREYVEVRVNADPELIDLLAEATRVVWQHVQDGTLPEPDGHHATTEALSHIFRESIAEPVEIGSGGASALADYIEAHEAEKAAKAAKDEASNRLRFLLGEHEVGLIGGEPAVTWRPQKRRSIAFRTNATGVPLAKCRHVESTTESRVLRPKRGKTA